MTTTIRDRYKQMTRESILDAFGLLLERDGAAAVSIAEVARVAGVSDTTVYNHFKNREDLLDAFTAARMGASLTVVLSSRPAKESPVAALRGFLRDEVPAAADQTTSWQPMLAMARRDDGLWGAFLRGQQRSADELAEQFLERRPAWSRLTARAAANAVIGVMAAAISEFPDGGTYAEFFAVLDAELARLERAWKS